MGLQFRILTASNSGDYGAGGGVVPIEVESIIPSDTVGPYKGQGAKYIYRKYFLNILDFTAQSGQPEISDVSVTSIGETTATVNWHTNEDTTTELYYGTTLNYGEYTDGGYGTTLLSGDRSVVLNGLEDTTSYFFKIVAKDADELQAAYYGNFNTVDATAPVFSNVQVTNVTPTTARVVWNTDEPSTTQVFYGTPTVNTYTTKDNSLVTAHIVNLVGLTPNSTYRYYVSSIDAYSNSGRSPDVGSNTFATQDSAGAPALTISAVTSGAITDSSAQITWTTSNLGNTIVKYSNSEAQVTGTVPGALFYSDFTNTVSHTGTLSSLSPATRYYFQPYTKDVYNQEAYAPSSTTSYYFDTIGASAPVVTFQGITVWPTSGTVTFSTDKTASGSVDYALLSAYNTNGNVFTNVVSGSPTTSHSISLTSLSENRNYIYRIKAVAAGLTGFDSIRQFSTTDGTPPVLSNVNSGTTSDSITVTWNTNENSTTILEVGDGTLVSPNFFTSYFDGTFTTAHSATLNGLTASTNYVFAARSVDTFNNTGSYSGTFTTNASGPGDTIPPVVSNINVTPTTSTATFNWVTNEYASTVVDYSTVSNLATYDSVTGQSGTTHSVSAAGLSEETTYYYRIKSEDAAANLTTTTIGSFDTLAQQQSNLAIGDKVCKIEIEWPDTTGMVGTYFPIRVCVPVRDDNDLAFPWATDITNSPEFFVQREVTKRDGGGSAKIVECIFPVSKNAGTGLSVGQTLTFYLVVKNVGPTNTFTPYSLPRIPVTVYYGGGALAGGQFVPSISAEASIQEATKFNGVVMRGGADMFSSAPLSSFPYCRTTRYYRRAVGPYNAYARPTSGFTSSDKCMGVHFYVTHYDKNIFPDFYPQVDIRVSNAWTVENDRVSNDSLTYTELGRGNNNVNGPYRQSGRGVIFFNLITVLDVTVDNDGIGYGLTPDVMENSMAEIVNGGTSNGIQLVKANNSITYQLGPNRVIDTGGGNAANGTLQQMNVDCSHAFPPGAALTWRLGLYKKGDNNSKRIMGSLASVEFSGFVYKDELGLAKRHWGNTRSFGPLNIYCPTIKSQYSYNISPFEATINVPIGGQTSFTGRAALNQKHKTTYLKIKKGLQEGRYYQDAMSGDWEMDDSPVQFGPWRPVGSGDSLPTGGTYITPFEGFNHAKYSTLYLIQLHKMRSHRSHSRMYSTKSYQDYEWGNSSSFKVWTNLNQYQCSWLLNGGSSIVGRMPFEQLVDRRPSTCTPTWDDGNGIKLTFPWNLPKWEWTGPGSASNRGCFYWMNAQESAFPNVSSSTDSYTDQGAFSTSYKLENLFSSTPGHSHQILYLRSMIAPAELINDLVCKDDLIAQADFNMLGFCPYGHSNAYYTSYLNLAEVFYGYDRSAFWGNPNSRKEGFFGTNANRGTYLGRIWAWPTFAVAAAYQLALYNPSPGVSDTSNSGYVPKFRDYSMEFFIMLGKLYAQGYLIENGGIQRAGPEGGVVSMEQHPGIAMNALETYLITQNSYDTVYGWYGNVKPPQHAYSVTYTDLKSDSVVISSANTDQIFAQFDAWGNPSDIFTNGESIYCKENLCVYPATYVVPESTGRTDNGIRFWVDGWINASGNPASSTAWKVTAWAKVTAGSYRLRARIVIVSQSGVDQRDVTFYGTAQDDTYSPQYSNTSSFQKIEWTIKLRNPWSGAHETFYPAEDGNANNPPYYVRVYLYANATTAGAAVQIQNGVVNGNPDDAASRAIKLVTPMKAKYRQVFDFSQAFEIGLLSMAYYAVAKYVLSPYASLIGDSNIATVASTIISGIRQFYYGMYSMPVVSLTPPYSDPNTGLANVTSSWNSSSLVKNDYGWTHGGSANLTMAEAWLIGTAYSIYHPTGLQKGLPWNGQLMWGRFTADASRQNTQDKGGYVSAFSSLIAILCMLEQGEVWSNSISQFTTQPAQNVPAFLLYMWCQLGAQTTVTDPLSKEANIYTIASNSNSYDTNPQFITQTAAYLGFIDFAVENPGLLAQTTSTVPTVPSVKVYIANESSPGRAEIAATPYIEDSISGNSTVNRNADMTFMNNGLQVSDPIFASPKGRRNSVTLYNTDGVYGGPVKIGDEASYSVPFWVRYRIDENTAQDQGYIDINVIAGDGPPGIAIQGESVIDDSVPEFAYYNDPSGDTLRMIGSSAGGLNSAYKSSTPGDRTYYFEYAGDENLQYVLDFNVGKGNANGFIVMTETYSQSTPVLYGGLRYLSAGGTQYNATGLSGVCTLNSVGISTIDGVETLVARFTDAIDGGRNKKYSFSIEGKVMRITMECTDANMAFSGNYNFATLGFASSVDSSKCVEMVGNGMNPIGSFLNSSNVAYYWGALPDLTQSNAQRYQTTNPALYTAAANTLTHGYVMQYLPATGNTINAIVKDQYLVGVSQSVKDLFVVSTAPPSPFLSGAFNNFHLLIGCQFSGDSANTWNSSADSVENLLDAMYEWGMDNMSIHFYYGSQLDYVSEFYPLIDGANAASTISKAVDYGWQIGPYTIYNSANAGSIYYKTGYFSYTTSGDSSNVGTMKKPSDARSDAEIRTFNDSALPIVVQGDVAKLKANYGFNSIMHDVYGSNYPQLYAGAGDSLDQGGDLNPNAAKTIREGIIQRKLQFDAMRQIVQGPLWSEGPHAVYDNDMSWLYHGYIDANMSAIDTFTGVESISVSSGNVRAPTMWWTIPETQWRVQQPYQAYQGVGIEDRFFGASDYDVAFTQTGGWQYSDMFPFTIGAMDRIRAYTFSHARSAFLTTNGYQQDSNNVTFEQLIMHYYMTQGVQQRMYTYPVEHIRYHSGGNWYTFDEFYKTNGRSMTAFTGLALWIKMQNQNLDMFINHNQVPGNTITVNALGDNYILPRDGFLAYDANGFVAFNAQNSNTNGEVIEYCFNPGQYEFFHGKSSTCTQYGNLLTEDDNTAEMKVWNYNRGITVYSTTGIGDYPRINITQGYS